MEYDETILQSKTCLNIVSVMDKMYEFFSEARVSTFEEKYGSGYYEKWKKAYAEYHNIKGLSEKAKLKRSRSMEYSTAIDYSTNSSIIEEGRDE